MTGDTHAAAASYPCPSGWIARCTCLRTYKGIDRVAAEAKRAQHIARPDRPPPGSDILPTADDVAEGEVRPTDELEAYGRALEDGFAALRAPFPDDEIQQITKEDGFVADFVGHARVRDRLLQVDPYWTWAPMARTPSGAPAVERTKDGYPVGLWIELTVLGVTRPGYGTCAPRKREAVKELIGDALRNAGMSFGIGLDLWIRATGEGSADPQDAPPDLAPVDTASTASSAPPAAARRQQGGRRTQARSADHQARIDLIAAALARGNTAGAELGAWLAEEFPGRAVDTLTGPQLKRAVAKVEALNAQPPGEGDGPFGPGADDAWNAPPREPQPQGEGPNPTLDPKTTPHAFVRAEGDNDECVLCDLPEGNAIHDPAAIEVPAPQYAPNEEPFT